MFQIDHDETFPGREENVLGFWQRSDIFQKSLKQRENAPVFSFYDGPPFATGLPHYGHILQSTIKDAVPRYMTMKGYYVPRRFGWDCHGLPIENEVEKAHELTGATSIREFGVAQFNEECRKIVLRYTKEWEHTVQRMGRWVDFSQTYLTMNMSYMESVWWVFAQLYGKGLVYEGLKVMPFSAKLGTPLSNFEANLNYRDVEDPSLTVTFPLRDQPDTSLLVWTTTPWTLPANLAVAMGGNIDYVKVKDKLTGHMYILAKARLGQYFKENFEAVAEMKGSSLKGLAYVPIFPYFTLKKQEQSFHVLLDDFVSTEDGTGIVHMAPAFGEADFFICAREGIEPVCPIDQNGKFTDEVPDYQGMFVKDADKEIIRRLKAEKRVFHHGQIRHRYPFCWRSDTPLIYKAVKTWFVSVEKIKERLLEANEKIHWVPDHIKHGRFGKWLESARDWAISRNRYWGTPIPIWRNEKGDIIVISSAEELSKRTGKKIADLHCHYIDDLTFEENGSVYRRIPEVFDCWFESGSMPYASNHFPFENPEKTLNAFPADFIAEGIDQTRGWFYTLMVIAVGLFDKPAFKNVICSGIILAEDGNKMSKRLKNYPEPSRILDEYGADAMRLYLINSPAVKAEDLRFSESGVELVLRQFLIPLWNSHVFLSTYARIYGWKPKKLRHPHAEIDRWILSLVQKLISDVSRGMEEYELTKAVEPFVGFIDQLTDWYIRRSRSRFWSEKDTQDREDAFSTLYYVLTTLTKVAAPFIPFLSDAIYRELRKENDPESVHLCDFPEYESELRNEELEKEMAYVQAVASLGHGLRKEHRIKVRQPLKKAHIICSDVDTLASLKKGKHLIADELNVKEVDYHPDETAFVQLTVKPNFRVLGKKVGKQMAAAQKVIEDLHQSQRRHLLDGKSITVDLEGQPLELFPEDVAVERKVLDGVVAATTQGITVAIDTELNDDLLMEGLAREMVNKINSMRRDGGFAVTDRIFVRMKTTPRVQECWSLYGQGISREVLAEEISFEECEGTVWDLNGEPATIAIEKV